MTLLDVLCIVVILWGFFLAHIILAAQSSHCKPTPRRYKGLYLQQIGLHDNDNFS